MARYIDADKLREYWLENGVNECIYNTNNVLGSIDYQPTADVVEVKHGEWIKPQFVAHRGFYEVKEFKCSVCNKTYEVKQPCNLMNYCPNCGVKMEGGKTK